MSLKILVSSRIREARRAKGWTQQRAADEFGIGQTTWASWETGSVNIPLDVIDRMTEIFERPVEFFIVADYQYTVTASKPAVMAKKESARRRKAA